MKTKQTFAGMSSGLIKQNTNSPAILTTRLMKIPRKFSFISTIATTLTTTSTTTSTATTAKRTSLSKKEGRVIKSIDFDNLDFYEAEFKPKYVSVKAKIFKSEVESQSVMKSFSNVLSPDQDENEDFKPENHDEGEEDEGEAEEEETTDIDVMHYTTEATTRVEATSSGYDDDFNVTLDNNFHPVESKETSSEQQQQYAYIIVPIKLWKTNKLPPNLKKKVMLGEKDKQAGTKPKQSGPKNTSSSSNPNLDGIKFFFSC